MPLCDEFCREEFNSEGKLVRFDLRFPDNYNFGYDVVDRIADMTPEKTALVWCNEKGEEHIFNFRELSRLSNQAANALRGRGIGKGDRVLLVLKKRYEYWYITPALHKLGAVVVPVSYMLQEKDLIYRINKIGVKVAIIVNDEEIVTRFNDIRKECPTLQEIETIGENSIGFYNLNSAIPKASDQLERVPTSAYDLMIIYFTSGTTDYPKAVGHNHIYSLAHIPTAKYWQRVEDGGLHLTVADTGWGKASWGKIYGQWLGGAAVMVFDFEIFAPRRLIDVMNHYHVTTFCAPPTVYRYMVKRRMYAIPNLKHASSAGEYLAPEISSLFRKTMGIPIAEGYGQTETTLTIANIDDSMMKAGSMGRAVPLFDVRIQKEDGSFAEDGEVGEIVILVRPGQFGLFDGYIEDQNKLDNPVQDGIYHTCDMAWRDKDGFFWFKGRRDDVIKTGGFRVGPVEIESVLIRHPAVQECSVIGIADSLRGQAIKANVVLTAGYSSSPELKKELIQFSNSQLATYMHIRYLDFVDELPKTFNGKIRKHAGS